MRGSSLRSSLIRMYMPLEPSMMLYSSLPPGIYHQSPSPYPLTLRNRSRKSIYLNKQAGCDRADSQETTIHSPTRHFPSHLPPSSQSRILQLTPRRQSPQCDPHFLFFCRPRIPIDNMAWRDLSQLGGIYSQDLLHGYS